MSRTVTVLWMYLSSWHGQRHSTGTRSSSPDRTPHDIYDCSGRTGDLKYLSTWVPEWVRRQDRLTDQLQSDMDFRFSRLKMVTEIYVEKL
jgi:hypothetical protein